MLAGICFEGEKIESLRICEIILAMCGGLTSQVMRCGICFKRGFSDCLPRKRYDDRRRVFHNHDVLPVRGETGLGPFRRNIILQRHERVASYSMSVEWLMNQVCMEGIQPFQSSTTRYCCHQTVPARPYLGGRRRNGVKPCEQSHKQSDTRLGSSARRFERSPSES